MAIWRYSLWDAVMFALRILHTVATITLVVYWDNFTIVKVIVILKVFPIFDHS
ncbi:hypothetical protein [Photorhabdus antumapuensis]|uniref:hypothetical protein n=1 Tax=Photorhabdus antumapuensis TaxID=2862867 RepID=UPI001CEDC773|nr:hypothetical protein [Photorhabdus antumapuensis]MCA6221177.1 hypothetical protein [Photorhabdus antumapuensis]